jgi:hypothetical protein
MRTMNDLMEVFASLDGTRRWESGPNVRALMARYSEAGRCGLWSSAEWDDAVRKDNEAGEYGRFVSARTLTPSGD